MTTPRALVLVPLLGAIACSAGPSGSPSSALASGSASQTGSAQASASQGSTGGLSLASSVAGTPGSGSCVPSAPSTFANAICVCEGLAEAGVLRTHATAPGAASVGVDQSSVAATGSDIEGSFVPYTGLTVAGDLVVRDATSSTGDVSGSGSLQVGGDLSVGGSLTFAGSLQVGGALRLANPAILVPGSASTPTAAYVAPAGPPCACDPSSLLPIASLVAAARTSNDNAAIGLGTSGADLVGAGNLTLPAGDYYFSDVTRVGLGTITVTGNVSLYLDGSIAQVGDQQITLAAGASLDLYVSGVIATAGKIVLGDPSNPGAFRLFVGGAGSMMATAGDQGWNGLVYAPQADVVFAGVTTLNGAIFAKSLTWAGALDVFYQGASSGGSTSCTPSQPDAAAPPSSSPAPIPH